MELGGRSGARTAGAARGPDPVAKARIMVRKAQGKDPSRPGVESPSPHSGGSLKRRSFLGAPKMARARELPTEGHACPSSAAGAHVRELLHGPLAAGFAMQPYAVIVDDNLESSETLAILLELEGYTAATAATLAEARARIAARRPDALILDRALPDGQGMDFVSEALSGGPMTIVMLTGTSDPGDAAEAIRRGASAYLVKPATIQQLKAVLDEAQQGVRQAA